MKKWIKTICIAFVEIIIFGLIGLILYSTLGLDKLIQYFVIVYFTSMAVVLIGLVLMSIFAKKLSWTVEPLEEDTRILDLQMNQFLIIVLTFLSFGFATILSSLSTNNSFIQNVLYIISVVFVYLGINIFISKFLPWRRKLLIKYKLEERK